MATPRQPNAAGRMRRSCGVRPMPNVRPVTRFRLCVFRPPRVCRWGDACTFAHSEEELNVWNRQNVAYEYGLRPMQCMPPMPPMQRMLPMQPLLPMPPPMLHTQLPSTPHRIQQQDSWPELHTHQYPPRSRAIKSTFLDRVKKVLSLEDITPALTFRNYKEKFHNLLCWEEMEHISLLRERCNGCYHVTITGYAPREINARDDTKQYGYLDVADGDIVAYATQASEAVYLVKGKMEIKAEILRNNYAHIGNRMYISVDKAYKLPSDLNNVEAQFEVKHSFFDSLHNALNGLSDEVVRRLFPQEEDFDGVVRPEGIQVLHNVPHGYHSILHLDQMQQDKLLPYQVALTCASGAPPVLISGPFGTGKTCFLASIAYCFIAELSRFPVRVLICAHHQGTADTILHSYFGPMLQHNTCPLRATVIRITPNTYNSHSERYNKCLCSVHQFKRNWRDLLVHEAKLVVITTFLTSLQLRDVVPAGFFTHILIDEGAQAREPEAIAPLCLADKATKIVIAGDPCQVGPALLVLGEKARQHGLKTSLLERLRNRYREIGGKTLYLRAELMENYRCHKNILKFASDMFYNSCVKPSGVTAHIKVPHGFLYPLVFVCTGFDQIKGYTQNVNEREADILMRMISEHATRDGVDAACVMSSSRSQVTLLRQKKKRYKSLQCVRVLPTFDIQGQEYDMLYISTCETTDVNGETRNPTKSLCDLYVFNTAITRARSLIVAFGNPYLLLSIEEHMHLNYNGGRCWSQFIKLCLLHNTLIIPDSVVHTPLHDQLKRELMTTIDSLPRQDVGVSPRKPQQSLPQSHRPEESTSGARELVNAPVLRKERPLNTGLTLKPQVKEATHQNQAHPSPPMPSKPQYNLTGQATRNQSISRAATVANTDVYVSCTAASRPPEKRRTFNVPRVPVQQRNALTTDDFPTLNEAKQVKVTKRQRNLSTPSQKAVEISGVGNTKYFLHYQEKLDEAIFEGPLTPENYKERFHHLLCWEEKEHMSILSNRCNGRYLVEDISNEVHHNQTYYGQQFPFYGVIRSLDGNEDVLAYAKQAAESAIILINGMKIHVDFTPSVIYPEGITVGFSNRAYDAIKSVSWKVSLVCDVLFELKHSYFNRQHEALEALPSNAIHRLLPSRRDSVGYHPSGRVLHRSCLELDDLGQMQALTGVLQQGNDPIIIAGPFGTGKTRVLARAAYEVILQHRDSTILICTHHQSSADTFIEYFQSLQRENRQFDRIKIVRICPFKYGSRISVKYPHYYRSVREASHDNPQVIVSTLGLSHHLKIKSITHIFIDEAAQTRETEAIIPLQHVGFNTKIVLAGDHCQVGPDVLVLGEEARRHGLSTSLLERLHNHFTEMGQLSSVFSLLQNHRSHNSLLSLPSALFYRSTLQCNVPDSKAHPLAPFPLVFVCSSIEDISSANAVGTDEKEAETLVREVKRYVCQTWPEEWGERCEPPGQVCIMTPSATQKSVIFKKMRKVGVKRGEVDVMKSYEIQGCEFTAVFLGTCETTDERGVPNNTTKTIINRYIFNTALTRARYLVVAVGNPLQILRKEEEMYKSVPANQCFWCWKEFIKRCIECRSFYLPEKVSPDDRKEFTEMLYQHIYKESDKASIASNYHGSMHSNDSILSAYKKKLEMIPECRQSKLRLTSVKGRLAWTINESPKAEEGAKDCVEEDEDVADAYMECRLKMISFSKGEAIPLNANEKVVQIRGKGNINGALHEDIVKVSVFDEHLYTEQSKGKVIRVVRRCHKQTLICKASPYSPTLFYPLDKRYPIISNLPKLSRDLLEKKDRNQIDAELKSKDVVVFEALSLQEGNIPEIKNVIPFSLAQDMIFVLRILWWNPKYRSPLGVVIHAVPKGCSPFHAERLLMIEHGVHYEDESDTFQPESRIVTATTLENINARAFTIDPEDAVNLDDAISLLKMQDSYRLSVHIVNTTKEIVPDGEIDKKAAAHGQSVYGGKKVMNIFPSSTRARLSLNPHQICDVITISADVVVTNDSLEIKDVQLEESSIKSCAKLSYKSAQSIMDGAGYSPDLSQCIEEYNRAQGQPNLQETLTILFKIAMKLRIERLGELAAQSYDMDDPKEQECWQTHLMVEEMMIWANKNVASHLLSAFPECVLLRRQAAPNAEELEVARNTHCNVTQHSRSLSRFCKPNPTLKQISLIIPLSTLHALLQAIEEDNVTVLQNLLTDDSLFPQLNASTSDFRRIQQKAEYLSATRRTEAASYSHYSLCLPVYTHFTSPLRRYADIVVQRMLQSLLLNESCRYTNKSVQSLCLNLNHAALNAKSFEKKIKALKLAVEYTDSSQLHEAVVTKNTTLEIELSFMKKELKVIPTKSKHFKVRHLQCKKGDIRRLNESDKTLYTWSPTLISLDENSSFPYDYEDISFPDPLSSSSASSSAVSNLPHVTMTLFQELEGSDMLRSVIQNVNVSPTTTAVSSTTWKHIRELIRNPSKQNLTKIQDILHKVTTTKNMQKTAGRAQIKSPVVKCNVACRMDVYDLVKVWMSWSTHEGILSPAPQMIEIAPFFRVCLQHNANPAECFSDPHLTNASRERYADLKEYVRLWEKVLLAEAAVRCISDNKTGIIYGAKLDWGTDTLIVPPVIGATHYEPKQPIKLDIPSETLFRAGPFFKINVGDMVCARYGTTRNSENRAVFHFVVTAINENVVESAVTTITLGSFGKENVQISEKMKPHLKTEKCEIQVIHMSPSYRRVYKVLLSLVHSKEPVSEHSKKPVSELLKIVARGKGDEKLKKSPKIHAVSDEILRNDLRTKTLWSSKDDLNISQMRALKLSLNRRFLLIQGPPGTGKSETGAHIAYTFAMCNRKRKLNECVLYCAPTNKAVDVVLRNLDRISADLRILRVYGKAVEYANFPGPHCKKEMFDGPKSEYKCPEWAKKYALHWNIRNISSELREMEDMFKKECRQGHVAGAAKYHEWRELINELQIAVMSEPYDIVLCTCNEAASGRIRQGLKSNPTGSETRVLQCVIDESGMAYEPETIVPMRLCEHVILIGDHKQLQPVIEYKPARENGLTTSLFERYAKTRKTEMLTIQYRMHEEICRFPSDYFYEGKLETHLSVKRRRCPETNLEFWQKGSQMPIMFCDFVGKESQVGLSKSNPEEAEKAVQIVKVITKVYNVDVRKIALMTPYKAQKECLKKLAEEAGFSGIAVATITESQGDEYGIVILSTVRSQPLNEISNEDHVQADRSWQLEHLGFLTDQHEINVGITRSKYGLIIIGNKTLLNYDDTWRALIAHYKERKCVIASKLFPSKEDLKRIS